MNERFTFMDIDTQYDFIMPGGNLYVPQAEQLLPNLKRLTTAALERGVPLISSMDAHTKNDPEFQQFPPHCVQGTAGQRKVPETLGRTPMIVESANSAWDAMASSRADQLILEKQQLDVFSHPVTESLVEKARRSEFIVYGVTTEYCVQMAVLGLLKRGHRVFVVEDAIKAITAENAAAAIQKMQEQGAELTWTVRVLAAIENPMCSIQTLAHPSAV